MFDSDFKAGKVIVFLFYYAKLQGVRKVVETFLSLRSV